MEKLREAGRRNGRNRIKKLRVETYGFEVVRTGKLSPADGRRMSSQPALSSPVGSRAGLDRDTQEAASHGPSHATHGYA
jgi:hypothetical protein